MIQHTLIALALQALIYLPTGNALASALPFLAFVGREQSQAEYRYLAERKLTRAQVDWLVFKSLRNMNLKSTLDWLIPMTANLIVYGVLTHV